MDKEQQQDRSAEAKPHAGGKPPQVDDGFKASQMIEALDGGTFARKLNASVRQCARAVYNHDDNRVKATINIRLTMQRVGDGVQQMVEHRIESQWPTMRGKKSEQDTTQTVMYTNSAGALTVMPENQGHLFGENRSE